MFTSLDLAPVYDSADCDLVHDLMVPLLMHAQSYMRGVGFFASGWLRVAASGIAGLIENGGTAQYVVSPILQEADWTALLLGDRARSDAALKEILSRNIADIATSLEADTRNTLAWMIADGLLEFRFAIPRARPAAGDYHDKVGIFVDADGNSVAIHGSFNDTVHGTMNGEAFSVFKSWEPGQAAYVARHRDRLRSLWNDENTQFRTLRIPEVACRGLVDLRTTPTAPYSVPATSAVPAETLICPVALHPYQRQAIEAWCGRDERGILEMATGTGKTYTSLAAALEHHHRVGRVALITTVPYLHLMEQWAETCQAFGFAPILCSSEHPDWPREARSRIQDFGLGALGHLCFIVVHQTAASPRFGQLMGKLNSAHTMLIADEVHALGAPHLRKALLANMGARLGLSATPRRWFDEEGTGALIQYFGDICFEFTLDEAIGEYLTPYEYRPQLVALTDTERTDYAALSAQIATLVARDPRTAAEEERLSVLFRERAHLVGTAEAKLPSLLSALSRAMREADRAGDELRGVLVYCAAGAHKEVLRAIADMGLKCHEFVHTVSMRDRRRLLSQFGAGEIQVLVAVRCLDEGVDVPSTRTAFLLASSTNPREFVQRRGRILRKAPGKSKAVIYDYLVVPTLEEAQAQDEVGASLLRREMPRFAEFASSAMNAFAARAVVRDLLDAYHMLGSLEEKPWDVYRRMTASDKDED
jgi:superfamily II DNA or RNA helicase